MRWFILVTLLLSGSFLNICRMLENAVARKETPVAVVVSGNIEAPAVITTPVLMATPTSSPTVIPTATPTVSPTPLPPTSTPTSPPTTLTVTVPGEVIWFDTGIEVRAGQNLSFSASGTINLMWGDLNSNVEPGSPGDECPPYENSPCLMSNAAYGALIGKIGDQEPFRVGANLETTASASGILYLTANDNHNYYYDNSGAYQVTIAIGADPTIYDTFDNPAFEGSLGQDRWGMGGSSPQLEQHHGVLVFTLSQPNPYDSFGLYPTRYSSLTLDQFQFVEAKLLLSSETETSGGGYGDFVLGVKAPLKDNRDLTFQCAIGRETPVRVKCSAYIWNDIEKRVEDYTEIGSKPTNFDTWHTVRIEVDREANVTFSIDGQSLGSYRPQQADEIKNGFFSPNIWIYSETPESMIGHLDDVRIGQNGL
ncbi:MAG: hypothetical protein HC875_17280 [Anaerolineales bacterium]|nr:hypothetical protein [Anaerolineales bacterium]